MKTAQKSVHMTPYLTPYLNFEALVLGCIGTYRGVQRLILQRFSNSTRKKQAGLTDSLKNAKFRRGPKCRRAVSSRTTRIPYRCARKKKRSKQFFRKILFLPQLSAIASNRSETLHISSTDRDWPLIQFWAQSVLITKSYDRDKLASFPYWKWSKISYL